MMVKALCCHSFARQNLFSPVARASAIACAGSLAIVASEDHVIRVFDLCNPGAVLSEIPTSGKVRCLAVSPDDSFIVALESTSRSSSGSTSRRLVRCYRNFLTSPFLPGTPRSAVQPPPPSSAAASTEPEILEFSAFHSPGCLILERGGGGGGEGEATALVTRLAVSAGRVVWLTSFLRERRHFRFDFSLKFDFNIHRLDLLGDMLATASTEEVHMVRMRKDVPAPHYDDAVLLPSIEKERREVGRSQRGLEVLGPTTSLDVASVTFNPTSHTPFLYLETLLFKRLPQSHTIKLHSVQLCAGSEPTLLVASTFEGFSFLIGKTVNRSAHYAFTERTLKARIGKDGLLHVITTCGLNTFTARLGGSGVYGVPARFPICLIGSLVWREIHMRTLETWSEGLLLYTEKDNLHTLYSLKYHSSADTFADMLQTARIYLPDSPTTSCHLLCEAFHLHSLCDAFVDREKVATLLEFNLSADCDADDLIAILSTVDLTLEEVVMICEQMQKSGLPVRALLRSFANQGKKFEEKLRDGSVDVVAMFYALLASCDKKLHVQSLLIRNDKNWLLAHEEVLLSLSSEDPLGILLNCLFLFETSQLDEIESFVFNADEKSFLTVLKNYPHLLIDQEKNELTDFAQYLTFVHPCLFSLFIADLSRGSQMPQNLPTCCRAIIEEEFFCSQPSFALLRPLVTRLLRLLNDPGAEGCPHRNLRCRQVPTFLLNQRLPFLNALPPFLGVVPVKAVHSAAPSCRCCLCQSALVRLQGLLSWALSSGEDLSPLSTEVCAHLSVLPTAAQPSLAFLLAHPRSVPRAFQVLCRHAGSDPAESYLRQESARIDRDAWMQLLTTSTASEPPAANQEGVVSPPANQKAKTLPTPGNEKHVSSLVANQRKPAANRKSMTSERLLRLAVDLNEPHVAAQLAEAMSGDAGRVRDQLLSRYRSEIAGDLFRNLMAGLEHM